MRPLKRAFTGPTDAVIATAYSFTPSASMLSQPGMHARNISVSFSASHARSCGTGNV
jgi:hypothetical protein